MAAAALRSLGGDIEVRRTDRGFTLQGYGCPLSAVTAKHPEVCALARALVEEITGEPVTECCERERTPQVRLSDRRRGPVRARPRRQLAVSRDLEFDYSWG